ncbi:MAG: GNAT family N-acetyltransferase [Abditibacteriaceae bacterium]
MEIEYRVGVIPEVEELIELFIRAGLNRPTSDVARIQRMYANANLVITAWEKNKLIGVARSLTDFCFCCYLSDLAVRLDYQKQGIGKQLIELTREQIGEQTSLILLAAPGAINYYPKVGMNKVPNGFMIPRTR